jgi:phenylpyruvate tautomerase PptA (4-oxalocrotonate tautomerase family)
MPSTLIEVRTSYTADEEVAIMDAVHDALVAAFRIPVEDRYVRLLSYEPRRMLNGPGPGRPDHYTRVTIDCFSGRSIEAKRTLYREVVERLESVGIARGGVSILLRESPPENWGLNGGQAASDHDLGFTIQV